MQDFQQFSSLLEQLSFPSTIHTVSPTDQPYLQTPLVQWREAALPKANSTQSSKYSKAMFQIPFKQTKITEKIPFLQIDFRNNVCHQKGSLLGGCAKVILFLSKNPYDQVNCVAHTQCNLQATHKKQASVASFFNR